MCSTLIPYIRPWIPHCHRQTKCFLVTKSQITYMNLKRLVDWRQANNINTNKNNNNNTNYCNKLEQQQLTWLSFFAAKKNRPLSRKVENFIKVLQPTLEHLHLLILQTDIDSTLFLWQISHFEMFIPLVVFNITWTNKCQGTTFLIGNYFQLNNV